MSVELLTRRTFDANAIRLRTGEQLGSALVAKGRVVRVDNLHGNMRVKGLRECMASLEMLILHS